MLAGVGFEGEGEQHRTSHRPSCLLTYTHIHMYIYRVIYTLFIKPWSRSIYLESSRVPPSRLVGCAAVSGCQGCAAHVTNLLSVSRDDRKSLKRRGQRRRNERAYTRVRIICYRWVLACRDAFVARIGCPLVNVAAAHRSS